MADYLYTIKIKANSDERYLPSCKYLKKPDGEFDEAWCSLFAHWLYGYPNPSLCSECSIATSDIVPEKTGGLDMPDEIDTQYTPKVVCPYCGHKFRDHTDDDMGKTDCEECEGVFEYTRNVEVTYCTNKLED